MDDIKNSKKINNFQTINIDVIADVICPWCYIGCLLLENSLKKRNHINFTINWVPFFIKPNIPSSGESRKHYLTNKFGDNYHLIENNIANFANNNGIIINLNKIKFKFGWISILKQNKDFLNKIKIR